MKLGEIKAESLLLMGVYDSGVIGLDYSNIDTLYNDDTVSSYLYAMNGSINRALSRLYEAGKLGEGVATFKNKDIVNGGIATTKINNYGKLIRAYIVDEDEREREITVQVEGGTIKVRKFINPKLSYRFVYAKKAPYLSAGAPSSTVIDIPDDVAQRIPYYVKGELLMDENPSVAIGAMKIFEQYLTTMVYDGGTQSSVKIVI